MFDDDLRRTLDTLTEGLRESLARQIQTAVSELAEAAARERAETEARSREEGRQEGREEGRAEGREEGRAEGLLAGQAEGRQAARQEGWHEGDASARTDCHLTELAARERLAAAFRAMDRARSLSDILDALADGAGHEAARVGILLVRDGRLRSWRLAGFGAPLDQGDPIDLPLADGGLIGDVVRTGGAAGGDSSSPASIPSFVSLPPGREMLAAPIQLDGQAVAVLYADQGPDETANADAARIGWPMALEVMTRHAAQCLQSITAFRAAQVLTGRAGGHLAAPPEAGDRSAADDPNDEEQAARRYARLLISEIKLYHEADVLAGRGSRDLSTRLGGEIARARMLYEQRVPAAAPGSVDHFQAELVRTLANGDASLLGPLAGQELDR